MSKRTPSPHAAAASAIRRELKAAYPTVAFSVRARSFSGGNAVDVDWVDGPTTNAVDGIIGKYQYGSFDGMQDLYEYTNRRDDLPQVRFTHSQRTISRPAYLAIVAELNRRYGWSLVVDAKHNMIASGDVHTGHGWRSHEVWPLFSAASLLCHACAAAILPGDRFCPACGVVVAICGTCHGEQRIETGYDADYVVTTAPCRTCDATGYALPDDLGELIAA